LLASDDGWFEKSQNPGDDETPREVDNPKESDETIRHDAVLIASRLAKKR